MARLYDAAGPCRLRPPLETHFAALVRSVTYQQLAGAAAAAIHGRLVGILEGEVTPERVLALPDESLRSVGLSGAKAASISDLAAKTLDGTVVLEARSLGRESDEEVIARLSTVRGIGRWTAEMFLIFQLGRLDVWPVEDFGVRNGYARLYGLADVPPPRELVQFGDRFRPYRSVAAWYCWRAADTVTPGDE
jgi:DNA-3-methyladenine glycosylase II